MLFSNARPFEDAQGAANPSVATPQRAGRSGNASAGRSSGTSQTTPSGGSDSSAEQGWPCQG